MDNTRIEKSKVEEDPKAIDGSQDIKMEVEPVKDLMCGQPFRNDAKVESQDAAVEVMSNMEKELTEIMLRVQKHTAEVSKTNVETMEMMYTRFQECKEKNENFEKIFKEFQNFINGP